MIHIIHNYYQEHQFFIFASYLALFILFWHDRIWRWYVMKSKKDSKRKREKKNLEFLIMISFENYKHKIIRI